MYYKVRKALLQSGVAFCIQKWDKWYYKVGQVSQSGTIFITKWYNNKVRQYRVQVRKARNSNRFWQQTSWLTPEFPDDRQFASWNSWEVELLLESKERTDHTPTRSQPHHWHICLTCKLEKQLHRGISCSGNCFS